LSKKENKVEQITKQSDKTIRGHLGKKAFSIIELLTVMSIIVILLGLLLPSLNMAKRYAKEVKQKAQFNSIASALELFSNFWGDYPPSADPNGDYCGAMKLCEALVGQDLMGFHPKSLFAEDFMDADGNLLYDRDPSVPADDPDEANLKSRKGPYLQLEKANAYRLWRLYSNTGSFNPDVFVLCDVYNRVSDRQTGRGIGMPILYYKADTSGIKHDPNDLPISGDDKGQFYNYLDNDELVVLGAPGGGTHLLDGEKFYELTKDNRITIQAGRPYRPDSYILISAGFDGLYGTEDDIFNFER
jgi:prepilin-type N-terminal cleavage/methylation domain-containing protein